MVLLLRFPEAHRAQIFTNSGTVVLLWNMMKLAKFYYSRSLSLQLIKICPSAIRFVAVTAVLCYYTAYAKIAYIEKQSNTKLEMWANAQRDGRPAKYRWRPLFDTAKFGSRPLLDAMQ